MTQYYFFFWAIFISFLSCKQSLPIDQARSAKCKPSTVNIEHKDSLNSSTLLNNITPPKEIKEALLLTQFKSLDELKSVIQIKYLKGRQPLAQITHCSNGRKITSILKEGISQKDFQQARAGDFGEKISLLINSPYAIINRKKLLKVYYLARRMSDKFGAGDPAFYDLAKTSMAHINSADLIFMRDKDLGEKGYINTFNHITAQVFMTSIFSEKLADFIADSHERANMPELITGKFTAEQVTDLKNGPIDNYVDIINNEWGQELGKLLQKKYNISEKTYWTPELLVSYLNDIQAYYSWAFQIGLDPYRIEDDVVIRFSNKLNVVIGELYHLK